MKDSLIPWLIIKEDSQQDISMTPPLFHQF